MAIKAGLAFAPPLRFAAFRALAAGAALLSSVMMLRRQPLLTPRRYWPWLPVVAGAGTVIAYGTMFLSPGRTGAGLASVLGNTTPLLIIVLAALVVTPPRGTGVVATPSWKTASVRRSPRCRPMGGRR
jgi:drug/metabolite transporter (DMT)-like permease